MARPTVAHAMELSALFEMIRKDDGMSSASLMRCHRLNEELKSAIEERDVQDELSEPEQDLYLRLHMEVRDGVSLYRERVT